MAAVVVQSMMQGWQVLVEDRLVLWDSDLERALVAALCVHARRHFTAPIHLADGIAPEALDAARKLAIDFDIVPSSAREGSREM